jgi:hypothetical protein
MKSMAYKTNAIELPLIVGEFPMIPFSVKTLVGLSGEFLEIAKQMLKGIDLEIGIAYFTIHGKKLKKGETLRRGGPHTDGNYEPHNMGFGGGGWKVGQDGPSVDSELHARQYLKDTGGIIITSNYASSLGYMGEYDGTIGVGGDCSGIELDGSFELKKGNVYYGNNHFIHESLPMSGDAHRVMARITLPENHKYNFLF